MISAEKIPNNVDLAGNKRLLRALEHWQPAYLDWWRDMGPPGFQDSHQVYLRTAVSVDAAGWAHFDYVKLPEYRWGIFLAEPTHDRRIGFGDFKGQPVWQEVPGEFRNQLRRLIVIQGDTEPASVEQQRSLGAHCPSLYDLRNLFQVNVEEGRHLWAMVYLLHSYFGRDGREEAEALLERRSGNDDTPRMLEAFNEPIDTWLDFFAFTMFTDRDGKSQLLSLSESSLDPLARTTRFMLTEEAHHMFVGESGIGRILERTCQLLRESGFSGDVRKAGGIDLPLIQKFVNFWFSQSLDLHGSEVSSNAAAVLLERPQGPRRRGQVRRRPRAGGQHVRARHDGRQRPHHPRGSADAQRAQRGAARLVCRRLPGRRRSLEQARARGARHVGAHRAAVAPVQPQGRRLCRQAFRSVRQSADRRGVGAEEVRVAAVAGRQGRTCTASRSTPVYKPGQFANYIAPPQRGINRQPIDFEYVRTEA